MSIEFEKLKSIEVGAQNAVTVTLMNGNSTDGTIPDLEGVSFHTSEAIEGLQGISEKGNFFIEWKFIKRIVFN